MDDNCIFCKVITGNLKVPIIHENETGIAINDINPMAPQHFLIIPKFHVANILESGSLINLNKLFELVNLLVTEQELHNGFRLVVNTGDDGGQTVQHLHVHLLAGRNLKWPPG